MALASKIKLLSKWLNDVGQNYNPAVENALLQKILEQEQSSSAGSSGHRFHIKRYLETYKWLPKESGKLLDLGGAYGIFSDILRDFTSYELTFADRYGDGDVICFDSEHDIFPFENDCFDLVLFTEVLEHFSVDPMHAISEINRILKPEGKLLLSTPNIASWKSIRRSLNGEQPGLFVPYMRHKSTGRHNREYTANEIAQLMQDAGFEIIKLDAIDVYDHVSGGEAIKNWPKELRGDTTFCLAAKKQKVIKRMPNWLYWPPDANS